jgi:hypothetical protein
VLDSVNAWTFGEGPTAENALLGAVEKLLIDLDESACQRRFCHRASIAGPGRDLKRAEDNGLPHLDFKRLHAARDFVERRENSDRIRNLVGLRGREASRQGYDKRGHRRKRHLSRSHIAVHRCAGRAAACQAAATKHAIHS